MFITPPPIDHFEAPSPYYSDDDSQQNPFSWAALYALQSACSLLGGMHAWVMRHTEDGCHILMRRDQVMEVDPELQAIIVRHANRASPDTVETVPWRGCKLLLLGLSDGLETDGCKYLLGMMAEKGFKMTEWRVGILDGLRCSLQTHLINW